MTAGQLQTILKRSGETPLFITFYLKHFISLDVLDQLKKQSVLLRWKSLAIKAVLIAIPPLYGIRGFYGRGYPALKYFSIETYGSTENLYFGIIGVVFRNLAEKPPLTHLGITISDDKGVRGSISSLSSKVPAFPTLTHVSINVLRTPTNNLDRMLSAMFHKSTLTPAPAPNLTVLDIRYPAEVNDSVDVEEARWGALGSTLLARQSYALQHPDAGIHTLEHLYFHISLPRGKTINFDGAFEELVAGGLHLHLHYEEI
jgi:hypothetical protein